jgi:SAM-dependent methyltransferase
MLIPEEQIQEYYDKFFVKDKSYYEKYKNITLSMEGSEREYWTFKDCPRLFSVLDFKEWIEKYEIKSGNKLFYTCKSDKELEYVSYDESYLFSYDESIENDLHTLNNKKVGNNFDFIIFNQTLEHLYNPLLAMKNLYSILKPGGYLYTSVPTINIRHGEPFHFWGMTPMGLCVLSKSAGFTVKELGYWGNLTYLEKIFKNNTWPDIFDVTDKMTDEVKNDPTHPVQTWILVQKEI